MGMNYVFNGKKVMGFIMTKKVAKKLNIPVYYFVSPQIWASRKGRIKQIAKYVKTVFPIFPFEKDIYLKAKVNAVFEGNPLIDVVPDVDNEKKLNEVAKVAFDSVDTDRSGQIDQEELEKVMAQISQDMGAEPPSKEDVKEVLEHLDTDHSGKIDFQEFSQLIKDVLNAMIEEDN